VKDGYPLRTLDLQIVKFESSLNQPKYHIFSSSSEYDLFISLYPEKDQCPERGVTKFISVL